MEIYILKSTAILAILWTLYVLILERENMHHFKRFYLLASIIAAVCIPLFTITEFVYVQPVDFSLFQNDEVIPFLANEPSEIIGTSFWNFANMLWLIYGIGVFIFSMRFIKNLNQIFRTIHTNEKQREAPVTFVLLKQLINPHTFFNYIFLNKTKFENKALPKEVILHEETHAKEKHSLDIFFIELLQIVFWFQPFIWLYKHRIKLNHEFLADQAVLEQGYQPSKYQNTLLSFSSNHQEYSLSNAINYSSIKKRFTVMKTQTSKSKIWLLSLLTLPILGILFYSFSDRDIIEIERSDYTSNVLPKNISKEPSQQTTYTARSISIKVLGNENYEVDGIKTNKASFVSTVNKLHQDISSEIRNKIINIHVTFTDKESNDEVWFIYNSLLDYGFHRLVTKNQEVIRSKGNTPLSDNTNYQKQQNPATAKEVAEYNTWAKKMKAKFKKMPESEKVNGYPHMINDETYRYYNSIHDRISNAQKNTAESLPEAVLVTEWPMPTAVIVDNVSKQQKIPTKKEVEEYNAWAKKLKKEALKAQENERKGLTAEYPIVKQKDLIRYVSIYKRMTPQQKANSVELPIADEELKTTGLKFPPPPPPQQKPLTTKEITNYNTWAKALNQKIKKAEQNKGYDDYPIIKLKDLNLYKSIYSRMSNKQKEAAEHFPNIPPPPPPPIPQGKVTDSQMKAYNKWVKEIKNEDVAYNNINKEDYKYFISIYNRMTDSQKKSSAGLPPPPPPPAIKKNK